MSKIVKKRIYWSDKLKIDTIINLEFVKKLKYVLDAKLKLYICGKYTHL